MRHFMGLMTQEELSELIGVEVDTLKSWRRSASGPDFVRLGKQIFYRRSDIQAWIDANVELCARAA